MRNFQIVPDEYRVYPDAEIKLPARGTNHAAAYDFYSPVDCIIQPGKSELIMTDVCSQMYWDNVLLVFVRSSMGKHPVVLANGTGVIDADYFGNSNNYGNIGVRLYNMGTEPFEIHKGDRIAQGMFTKCMITDNDETLGTRDGGFGSTGK